METIFANAFVYLLAAVIAVPIANRIGLGSVLGYLVAGIVIGPILGLVGNTTDIQHFAEFGVVMMLFLVGLELAPRSLWDMRAKLLGLGGLQVGGTMAIVMGIAMLCGLPWSFSLAIGMLAALSSTAIVLQTLNEKSLMKTNGGQSSFSVLLFQDIAVIPMIALVPLLAMPDLIDLWSSADAGHGSGHGDAAHADDNHGDGDHGGGVSFIAGHPPWLRALITVGAIGFVIGAGVFLVRPILRWIAGSKLREMFTAFALLLVIAIALLMQAVGLSAALGTFLAGVVLANSEYRHELESDIEPFKGLLLGLFFITVGAGINFALLFENIALILTLTIGLMLIKALVLLALSFIFKIGGSDRWLFTLGLAQAGEFGFVLLSLMTVNMVLPQGMASLLLLVIAISMLLTPALFIAYERLILPRLATSNAGENDEISEPGKIIIAGLGRFGQVVNRVLLSNGHKTVVLDHRAELIDNMRKFGVRSFYGDATRPDLLHAAGLGEADMLVAAIDDKERLIELVKHARQDNPNIHIVARAIDRHEVYRLYQAGADDIIRETFDSSVRAARSALEALGMHAFVAERKVRAFVDHDREALIELAPLWKADVLAAENPEYLAKAREFADKLERTMQGDQSTGYHKSDAAWTPPGEVSKLDGEGEA